MSFQNTKELTLAYGRLPSAKRFTVKWHQISNSRKLLIVNSFFKWNIRRAGIWGINDCITWNSASNALNKLVKHGNINCNLLRKQIQIMWMLEVKCFTIDFQQLNWFIPTELKYLPKSIIPTDRSNCRSDLLQRQYSKQTYLTSWNLMNSGAG